MHLYCKNVCDWKMHLCYTEKENMTFFNKQKSNDILEVMLAKIQSELIYCCYILVLALLSLFYFIPCPCVSPACVINYPTLISCTCPSLPFHCCLISLSNSLCLGHSAITPLCFLSFLYLTTFLNLSLWSCLVFLDTFNWFFWTVYFVHLAETTFYSVSSAVWSYFGRLLGLHDTLPCLSALSVRKLLNRARTEVFRCTRQFIVLCWHRWVEGNMHIICIVLCLVQGIKSSKDHI